MRRTVFALATLLALLSVPAVAQADGYVPSKVVRAAEFRVTPVISCESAYKVRVVFKIELREDPRFYGGVTVDGREVPESRIAGDIDIGYDNPTVVVNLPDGGTHWVEARGEIFSAYVPGKGLATGSEKIAIACTPPLQPPPPPVTTPPDEDCNCPGHEGKKHKHRKCVDCRGCVVKIKGPRTNPRAPSSENVYRVVMQCKGKRAKLKRVVWYLDGYRVHVGKVWRVTSGEIQTHGRIRGEHVIEAKVQSKKGCKDFKRIKVINLDP
jgi:hypothetical protein